MNSDKYLLFQGFKKLYESYPPIISFNAFTNNIEHKENVAHELQVNLIINGQYQITLQGSPHQLEELLIGYLFAEGWINSIEDVNSIQVNSSQNIDINLKSIPIQAEKSLVIHTSGQKGFLLDSLENPNQTSVSSSNHSREKFSPVSLSTIFSAQRYLLSQCKLWEPTGGAHHAGLFSISGSPICIAEDIARHNAIDKIIGYGILNKVQFQETFALLSGRISSSIIMKLHRADIPILASRAAPLSGGIIYAQKLNIAILGFLRPPKYNIYTYKERFQID